MGQRNKKPEKTEGTQKKDTSAKRRALTFVTVLILAVILIAVVVLTNRDAGGNANADGNVQSSSVLADQDLVIPKEEITEKAKFYSIDIEGTRLEVVAVEAPDGTIRTVFNTCQVCYDSGRGYYKQQGDVLVCQNCGNQFSMDRVEVETGGCNPWPVLDENKTVTDESITISYDFLKESKGIFANWKRSY